MTQHLLPRIGLPAAAVILSLTGCSGQAGDPTGGSTSAEPTASASSAPSASATPPLTTPTPSPSAPQPAPAVKRTSAQLKNALLALKDLPAGFEVDRSGSDDGTKMSSGKRSCAPLVRLMNSTTPAGSRAQAEASFSGGQQGPFVDETLDAMGAPPAARAFIQDYRKAVKACGSVRVNVPGVGSSKVAVREVSFSKIGDQSFAARFRAEGGPLDGLEIIQAGVQAGDIVVGVTTVGLEGPDAEAATNDATAKVQKKLATPETI